MTPLRRLTVLASFSLIAQAGAVPPAPQPDPSGINKNRYISMSVPDTGGNPVAIRVTLTSLMHPDPPNPPQFPPPDFSAFEGEYRWGGPAVFSTQNDNDATLFAAAPLQCAPFYFDFASLGLFHVYGDAVVPSSTYDATVLDASCAGVEDTCTEISPALQLKTERWGDVAASFQSPSPATLSQPNINDVSYIYDHISRLAASPNRARAQLQANTPDPTRTVNMADFWYADEAFKGFNYPFPTISSCSAGREGATKPQRAALGATTKLYLTPVAAQGASAYPFGTTIDGQTLHAPRGGFRAYFNVQISDWDPMGNEISLCVAQAQIDGDGFLGANANPPAAQMDLTYPTVACTTSSQCTTAFGENASFFCIAGVCSPAFINRTRGDWLFLVEDWNVTPLATVHSPLGPLWGGATGPGGGFSEFDDGQRHYLGTLVLDVPPNALGRYTIPFRMYETFVMTDVSGRLVDVPILEAVPAVVEIAPSLIADPSGIEKNRYLSFSVPDSGVQALRVTLASLMHPDPPNVPSFPAPDFSAFEGQVRWVGPVNDCQEAEIPPTTFKCALTQATPFYTDFFAATGGELLHVTGQSIVPSSVYDVQILSATCQGNEDACTAVSAPLTIRTQRWGDLIAPFQGPSPAQLTQPNIADCGAAIDKFKGLTAPSIPTVSRADINPAVPNRTVNISDCGSTIDAFRGFAYPFGFE